MNDTELTHKSEKPAGTLGTFAGVFTPSILTILGIILFLRLSYVTGSAGIGRAFLIILLANTISVLTSMSLSAVATNIKVKGGGDYFLISRTLGLQFGGAIGMVLFLAQSVSVAFYAIGFSEAVTALLPQYTFLSIRIVSTCAVLFLFVFAWLGADWATKFQYVVMVLLIAALASFYWGGLPRWETSQFMANISAPDNAPPFWIIFGIFFPAVTGFTQGVSMSGDLKNPGKSLPLGTFLAVGISILVYFSVAFIFAGILPNSAMMDDYSAMNKISRFGFIIDAGVIAATLSSAMASFLGAPRILQSLAGDKIFPFLGFFAKGHGVSNNPRRGILLTAVIAFCIIAIGQLNLVAKIVSMFFLISYGLLNYATYYEAKAESPSFRPRFKWFNRKLSLAGFIICLIVMMALDIEYGIIAAAILFAIYYYLKMKSGPSRWADAGRSYRFREIRNLLLTTACEPDHARDWRPNILAFTNDSERRQRLLKFADWIEGESGFITAVRIIVSKGGKAIKMKAAAEAELKADITKYNIPAFSLVVRAPDISDAISVVLQSYGIGALHVNTVLVNWFGETGEGLQSISSHNYTHHIRTTFRYGCNIIIFCADENKWDRLSKIEPGARRIDIWWQNDATGSLMLILAHLMTKSKEWVGAGIRVIAQGDTINLLGEEEKLRQTLDDYRIDATPFIVNDFSRESIVKHSADAAHAFMPFNIEGDKITDRDGGSFERIFPKMPMVALVMAAEDIDLDAEPDEGAAGEIAEIIDQAKEIQKKAEKAEKESGMAQKEVKEIKEKYYDEISDGVLAEDVKKKLTEAEEMAEKTFRKATRARAKADEIEKDAIEKGINIPVSAKKKPDAGK
ncbi:MAG: amino acid permease [Desulfobacterales bacterium]|nr:amino acid permease [Desulfobacterales bacterium]